MATIPTTAEEAAGFLNKALKQDEPYRFHHLNADVFATMLPWGWISLESDHETLTVRIEFEEHHEGVVEKLARYELHATDAVSGKLITVQLELGSSSHGHPELTASLPFEDFPYNFELVKPSTE